MFLQGRPPFLQEANDMKMTFLFSFVVSALCLLSMSSCREEGLQNVRGEVRSVNIHRDTLVSMTVNVNEAGDTLLFYLSDARFQKGIMMPKDSVIVDYIDRHDSLKALVVTVLPKTHLLEDVKPADTLLTAPMRQNIEKEKQVPAETGAREKK